MQHHYWNLKHVIDIDNDVEFVGNVKLGQPQLPLKHNAKHLIRVF